MSGYENPTSGDGEHVLQSGALRQLRARYIGKMAWVLGATTGRGAHEVHVLHEASLWVRAFQKWKLVDFPQPHAYAPPKRPWVNGEHLPGWILPNVVRPASPDAPKERASILLLSDNRCVYGGGPVPGWATTHEGLLVPEERLIPLDQAPETVNLHMIEQMLWPLMPPQYQQNPVRFLDGNAGY